MKENNFCLQVLAILASNMQTHYVIRDYKEILTNSPNDYIYSDICIHILAYLFSVKQNLRLKTKNAFEIKKKLLTSRNSTCILRMMGSQNLNSFFV